MRISDHIILERIKVPLAARTKDEVLRELTTLVARNPADAESILGSVLEREQRMSTGIGRGVAIPHAKSDLVADLIIASGVAAAPIDFGSLDRQPVRVLFLIVSAVTHAELHLEALGLIARVLAEESTREELMAARNADEFLLLLRENEEGRA